MLIITKQENTFYQKLILGKSSSFFLIFIIVMRVGGNSDMKTRKVK